MIKEMRAIAKDIINTKIDEDVINQLCNEFYQIALKHGIKEGERTKDGVGILTANYEWTMAKYLFIDCIRSKLEMAFFLNEHMPEELKCYDKQ
jgi:hypothetical protein